MSETNSRLTVEEIDFLKSLPDLDFRSVLANCEEMMLQMVLVEPKLQKKLRQSVDKVQKIQKTQKEEAKRAEAKTERERDRERKRAMRAKGREVWIPIPANLERRRKALANWKYFLKAYFPGVFYQEFTEDRKAMGDGIVHAAKYGGDQAIAGPRGEGKSRIALYIAIYLMVSGLSTFPMVIGKNQRKSSSDLKTVREKIQQNEKLRADFPEIFIPFSAVGNWSSSSRLQTVGGKFTNIEIAADHFIFPTVTEEMLPEGWPEDCPSCATGQIFSCMGIDGPIRGTTFRDERPTLAILDDIEDRQAANSDTLIKANEETIEQDVGGLGGNDRRIARVMLCTTQNRKCIAFKYTDPKQKRSWSGRRFRRLKVKPERLDLWLQYIELRQSTAADDPDARAAWTFYAENRDEMDAGHEISNPEAFNGDNHLDGRPIELSALQSYYNKVADRGEKAIATEEDNDPPEEAEAKGLGLTAGIICSRVNGLGYRQLPAATIALTAGVDIGKYRCHWVVIAWMRGAAGCVVDYGVQQIHGQDHTVHDAGADISQSEPQIYNGLLDLKSYFDATEYVDASGSARKLNRVLVDSGTYTNAAYSFTKNAGGIYLPSKGIGNYREKTKITDVCKPGDHMHLQLMESKQLWLLEMDTDYWKNWVHERFAGPVFDAENNMRPGALSLYDRKKKHLDYASQIVAEELVTEFTEGKGSKTFWQQTSASNHYLDATYMAAAAGRLCKVRLLRPDPIKNIESAPKRRKRTRQHGKRVKSNWVSRVR